MSRRKKQNKLFLLSWDINGLESLVDISTVEKLHEEEEKLRMLKILSDPEARDPGNQTAQVLNRTVNSILLRARYNPQRHYEVYTIQVAPSINEQDMIDLFNQDPQYAVDLIRERGTQLYSDRLEKTLIT